MAEKKVTYYQIRGLQIGKREDGRDYLLKEGEWVSDEKHVISDHLLGYDPYEPEGSPYAIGNTSIMDEIEVLTADEALPLIERQIQAAQKASASAQKRKR